MTFDSLSRGEIFDKTLIWCGQRFTDSKSALRMSNRESGLISGKAYFLSSYKMPRKKKDSIAGTVFLSYYFNWLIEIKENKMRVSINEIVYEFNDTKYPVKIDGKPPVDILFQSSVKNQLEWDLSKKYLLSNFDNMFDILSKQVAKKDNDW